MRSLLTIFALLVWALPTLASASALKGVRGHKRLLRKLEKDANKEMEKKCKKYAPKAAVAAPHELKEGNPKADPKAAKDKVGDKAAAKGPEAKATSETGANPKAGDAPKASDPEAKEAGKGRYVQDESTPKEGAPEPPVPPPQPKAPKDKEADELAREAECIEWFETTDREDSGSEAVVDPTMTSTGGTSTSSEFDTINVDCEAIANDEGPTDVESVSFRVSIDVLKDSESTLNSIYDQMEQELQQKVAPRVAGCSSGRFLAESSSTKIVHVDFGELEFDHRGCDSSLAKEARDVDGVCMASNVPVDVYFVGDFPENAIAKVEVAIEEHVWDVDGLMATSEVDIVQTASSLHSDGEGSSAGMIGGIVAAVAACLCAVCGYGYYKRNHGDEVVAKAELETDEESDDDKHKVAIPQVEARRVG